MPATLKSYVLTDRYICCRPRSAPQRRSSTKLAAQRTASSRQAHGALRTSVRAPEAAGKNSPAATEWGQRSRRGITGAWGRGRNGPVQRTLYHLHADASPTCSGAWRAADVPAASTNDLPGFSYAGRAADKGAYAPALVHVRITRHQFPPRAIERASRLVKAPSPPRCDPIGECAIAKREPPIEQAAPTNFQFRPELQLVSARITKRDVLPRAVKSFCGKGRRRAHGGPLATAVRLLLFFGGLDAAVRGSQDRRVYR